MSGLYGASLAGIHAAGYTARLRPAYPFLLDLVRRTGPAPVLHDLGCGDGDWLAAARDAGLPCSGSDLSPAFVALARARGLSVTEAAARTAPWPPGTTAITALGEVLSYLHDDAPSLWDVARHAARDLPKGGALIADLIGPEVAKGRHGSSGDGWQLTSEVTVADGILTRHMTVSETGQPPRATVHRQAVVDPDEVVARLTDLGFTVDLLPAYGEVPHLPGRFAIQARRT